MNIKYVFTQLLNIKTVSLSSKYIQAFVDPLYNVKNRFIKMSVFLNP